MRDVDALDAAPDAPARDVTHGHETLDAENEEVKMVAAPDGAAGAAEIPTPAVANVASYDLDYLPTYTVTPAYVRARAVAVAAGAAAGVGGAVGSLSGVAGAAGPGPGLGGADPDDDGPTMVEYDADTEDEAWLATVNADGQPRVPPSVLEEVMWRLELVNAAATDAALSAAGALAAERASTAAAAATDHLPKRDAVAALAAATGLRPAFLGRVYDHWRRKRSRAGRPLLRRLRAPTAPADTNPFHVFRPRERAHRPQTRRRREAGDDASDRLRALAANLRRAGEVLEWTARREARKRALACVEAATQVLALGLRHDPRSRHDALEADAAAVARSRAPRRPARLAPVAEAGGPPPASADAVTADAAKAEAWARAADPVATLPPPPPRADVPEFPPETVDAALVARLGDGAPATPDWAPTRGGYQPRAGRCGRLWFDPPPAALPPSPPPRPLPWDAPTHPYGEATPGAVLELLAMLQREKEAAAEAGAGGAAAAADGPVTDGAVKPEPAAA